MSIRVLHCLVDDKFIDSLIDVFEQTKGQHTHEYVLITKEKKVKYNLIRKTSFVQNILSDDCIDYVNNGNFNLVIIHGLASFPIFEISKIKQPIKVLWKAWGYDIYRYPDEISPFIKLNRFNPLTKKYRDTKCRKYKLAQLKVRIYNIFHRKKIVKAIRRIDYFSGCLPIEYRLMQRVSYFRARQLEFDYFDFNSGFTQELVNDYAILGNNILVGNSAGIPNNHLDILFSLKKLTSRERTIVLPLSYGGEKDYKEDVIKFAKEYWGENCNAIERFMPKDEYFSILESCGYAIFGYEQQAALGNIVQALWQGVKVFFSETSICYKYFKSQGFLVYSIQTELTNESIINPLSNEEKKLNRKAFLKILSVDVCLSKIYNLYKTVEKDIS